MKPNFVSSDFIHDKKSKHLFLIAPEKFYGNTSISTIVPTKIHSLMKRCSNGFKTEKNCKVVSTFVEHKTLKSVTYLVLPQNVSRGNSPSRKFFVSKHLPHLISQLTETSSVVFAIDDESHVDAMIAALARCYRTISFKTNQSSKKMSGNNPSLNVMFVDNRGAFIPVSSKSQKLFDSVLWGMSLIDRPPTELNPETYSKDIKRRFSKNKAIDILEISGKNLVKSKLSGIWSVGKAASKAPRLLCLHYKPSKSQKKIALVGKGVTYDSGGLNLKIMGSMSGMKADMGGSATVIAAFDHLIKTKCKNEIIAVLGLVENAISSEAYKPDDVIKLHSGLTVEINNTDAEGRLVLADCCSWVVKGFNPELLIDVATLTGAQLVATGKNHAAIVCNDEKLERNAIECGRITGDLVWPLVFAPDILGTEFDSKIADMKNSVKDRFNAQTSCAANFIFSHIEHSKGLKWLHVDMAGPCVTTDHQSTGYGINLLSALCQD